MIEALDRVLPVEDAEVSAVVEKAYRKRGIAVHAGARVERTDVGSDAARLGLTLKDGTSTTVEAERVLVAGGRACGMGETDGFVKVVRNADYDELLGAQIVGPHASELIGEFVVGRLLETTLEEFDLAAHPHPTLSDAIPEAALDALGRAIHI